MANFSDNLTPGQVQQILDDLQIPWRDYKPNKDGWIDLYIDDYVGLSFNSKCGINIYHGGFRDHYMSGTDEGTADIVKLVAMVRTGNNDTTAITDQDVLDTIDRIKERLGIANGVKPPELDGEAEFANEWLKKENENNYVRVPDDIWQSDLSASAKLVWMALFKRCGKGEIYSFPGIRRIATDTSMGINRVQRALSELKDAGVLLEKHRRADKPPNRYPVCKPVTEINTALSKFDKAPTKATDPVSKIDTACIQNEHRGVSKIDTELDTGNKNQELEPKAKVENVKTPFIDAISLSLFYLTSKQNIEAYTAFRTLPDTLKANWNPEWNFDSEFGQWLNGGGYPAAWDSVEPQKQQIRATA